MAFFDRFRVELRKYAEGVHELGDPVDDKLLAGRDLPAGLSDFLRSWDGVRLFQEAVVIVPLQEQSAGSGGAWVIGEWEEGTLELAGDGKVRSRGDDGAAIVVGSTLERFLAAVMAREGLLVDREGEFKDVFDDEGIDDKVRARQTAAALKLDPEAAAWHLEAAERAFATGDEAAAEAALARTVALDDAAGDAWALLGALQRRAQRLDAAEASFARAASATADAPARAERAAEAARAASEAGREAARAEHAALARTADAGAVARWIEEAREALREGDAEAAANRATLAAAVDAEEAAAVVKETRVRGRLKTV
jgi:tetratricopeptide (TPR) repeat protein